MVYGCVELEQDDVLEVDCDEDDDEDCDVDDELDNVDDELELLLLTDSDDELLVSPAIVELVDVEEDELVVMPAVDVLELEVVLWPTVLDVVDEDVDEDDELDVDSELVLEDESSSTVNNAKLAELPASSSVGTNRITVGLHAVTPTTSTNRHS